MGRLAGPTELKQCRAALTLTLRGISYYYIGKENEVVMLQYYEFVFYAEDSTHRTKGFWAFSKKEAWTLAGEWAYRNGYVDYKMED